VALLMILACGSGNAVESLADPSEADSSFEQNGPEDRGEDAKKVNEEASASATASIDEKMMGENMGWEVGDMRRCHPFEADWCHCKDETTSTGLGCEWNADETICHGGDGDCGGKPGGNCWPFGPKDEHGLHRCGLVSMKRTNHCAGTNSAHANHAEKWVYGKPHCFTNNNQDSDCTQASDTASGYWDYTDAVAGIACGSWFNWGLGGILMHGGVSILGYGMNVHFEYQGRVTNWADKTGTFAVIKVSGKPRPGTQYPERTGTVNCQMESGVKLWVCNQAAADGSSGCPNGEIIHLDSGHRLITPTNNAQAKQHCGEWFSAVSTTMSQVIGDMRLNILRNNPKASNWVKGVSVSE